VLHKREKKISRPRKKGDGEQEREKVNRNSDRYGNMVDICRNTHNTKPSVRSGRGNHDKQELIEKEDQKRIEI